MPTRKMHEDEIDIDVLLVRRLLQSQFPQWADLLLVPVDSAGSDHAIYRLGLEMAVRMLRHEHGTLQFDKEHAWLPRLAPHLPLPVPVQLAKGRPGNGYPWNWSVCRWVAGETAAVELIADQPDAAIQLAEFISALQRIDASGGPPPGDHNFRRGAPLASRDRLTRSALEDLQGEIDFDAATRIWEAALASPVWSRAPMWIHGDLIPGNLVVENRRLRGVVDFGGLGVGDPACDLMAAWTVFSRNAREAFRAALAFDEATWRRAKGWALSFAVIFVPYYRETNAVGVAVARRTINEVLADS